MKSEEGVNNNRKRFKRVKWKKQRCSEWNINTNQQNIWLWTWLGFQNRTQITLLSPNFGISEKKKNQPPSKTKRWKLLVSKWNSKTASLLPHVSVSLTHSASWGCAVGYREGWVWLLVHWRVSYSSDCGGTQLQGELTISCATWDSRWKRGHNKQTNSTNINTATIKRVRMGC